MSSDDATAFDLWVSELEPSQYARHNHPDTTLYDPARCALCAWYRSKVCPVAKPVAR